MTPMPLNVDDTGLDWCVYWLHDRKPGDTIPFYIGCTSNPEARVVRHCTNPRSSAYERCREIINAGRRPVLSIIARHAIREYALKQEAELIAEFADELVNGDLGRPSTGFDRVGYQRVYTRLRRLYGPLPAWPAALSQLRSLSKGTPHA